jgi:hypothetical protein
MTLYFHTARFTFRRISVSLSLFSPTRRAAQQRTHHFEVDIAYFGPITD